VFGLPEAKPDDAARALLAIVELRKNLTAWIGSLAPIVRDRLSVRIGGPAGPGVLSRPGSAHHKHVTAVGDTVNVTSRLLEVAKQQAAPVVISEDLYVAAGPSVAAHDMNLTESAIEVAIRGRTQGLRIRLWR